MSRRELLARLVLLVLATACAAWLGYDVGYSNGYEDAIFEADSVDMELRGVTP